ncbi:MAG: ankyrin repeat domain-containing protein [Planctomycetia bacterium]
MTDPEIHEAAIFGDYDRVRAILAADPKAIHARDKYGFTALHGVAGEDHPEMIRLLADAGADVNAGDDRGHTPLHLAANPEAVEALVEVGADVNARSRDGGTPLHLAAGEADRADVMAALLEAGADAKAVDARGETALDVALARGDDDKIALLRRRGG